MDTKYRYVSILLVIVIICGALFNYYSEKKGSDFFISKFAFKYGLDLKGGTELIYTADISNLPRGIYFISVSNGNGSRNARFVKD